MNNYDREARKSIERSILATCVYYSATEEIKSLFLNRDLNPEYFSNTFYSEVFEIMSNLYSAGQIPVPENIAINRSDRYRESFAEGISESETYNLFMIDLVELYSYALTKERLDTDVLLLKQFVLIDFWNRTADNILNSYWDNRDVLIVADNIINGYNNLLSTLTSVTLNEQDESIETIKEKAIRKYNEHLMGIDTTIKVGNRGVDEHIGGMTDNELVIIAGRPGMGKTAFALAVAKLNSLELKKKGLYFTLEMTKEQLMMKLASKDLKMPYKRLKAYNVSQEVLTQLFMFYDYIESSSLEIVYEKNLEKIVALANDMKPEFIVIDYLQLVTTTHKTNSREQEVAYISKTLKSLSKTANCPVIALAQLQRVEGRPKLMNLRESGSIEQDADTVIFPYRPTYDSDPTGTDFLQGNCEFLIPKCRSAGPGTSYGYIDLIGFKFYDHQVSTLDEYKNMLGLT